MTRFLAFHFFLSWTTCQLPIQTPIFELLACLFQPFFSLITPSFSPYFTVRSLTVFWYHFTCALDPRHLSSYSKYWTGFRRFIHSSLSFIDRQALISPPVLFKRNRPSNCSPSSHTFSLTIVCSRKHVLTVLLPIFVVVFFEII